MIIYLFLICIFLCSRCRIGYIDYRDGIELLFLVFWCGLYWDYFNIVGWVRCDVQVIICVFIFDYCVYGFVIVYNCIDWVSLNIFGVVDIYVFMNKGDYFDFVVQIVGGVLYFDIY